jgi:hypothetical protein
MRSLIALLVLTASFSVFATSADMPCKDQQGNVLDSSLASVTKIINSHQDRPQILITGKITKILPEDHSGLPHQKYLVAVSNNLTLQIVSNLDFGRIPVAEGQTISVCGEFKNVGNGMVHWTHFDPHGGHADGFTVLNNTLYGDKEVPASN